MQAARSFLTKFPVFVIVTVEDVTNRIASQSVVNHPLPVVPTQSTCRFFHRFSSPRERS